MVSIETPYDENDVGDVVSGPDANNTLFSCQSCTHIWQRPEAVLHYRAAAGATRHSHSDTESKGPAQAHARTQTTAHRH